MQILITGVSGFLGSHLADFHLKKGDSVFGIDNNSAKHSKDAEHLFTYPNFQFILSDLQDISIYQNLLTQVDLIYHFAAIVGVYQTLNDPELVLDTNIHTTEYLLKAIVKYAPHARVFIASSSEVYGQHEHQKFHEEMNACIDMTLRTRNNYAISKLVNEAYAFTLYEKYQLKITIIRLFNMIGPGQVGEYGMVIPRFIEAAQAGKSLHIFGDGQQIRTFCHVSDFVRFIHELINCPDSIGQIINIGGTETIKIIDLAKLIINLCQSTSSIVFIPYEKAYLLPQEFVLYRQPDLKRLFNLVKYRHQHTLQNTLEELIYEKN